MAELSNLPAKVKERFEAARSTDSLTLAASGLAILRHASSNIAFQLRYCPSLAKKPQPAHSEPKHADKGAGHNEKKEKFNPFADPSPSLLVTATPTHNLVLNKFPIIPKHFILATRTFSLQTDPLDPSDLAAAHTCLASWSAAGPDERLLAFFNSGDMSGASQSHRHLQFVPVEEIAAQGRGEWRPLIDEVLFFSPSAEDDAAGPITHPGLPFSHAAALIPPRPSRDKLAAIYGRLLRIVFPEHADEDFEAWVPSVHYNLAMTLSGMIVLPRRSDVWTYTAKDGSQHSVSINGTILAGTLMVKEEQDWDLLRNDAGGLDDVLSAITFPLLSGSRL